MPVLNFVARVRCGGYRVRLLTVSTGEADDGVLGKNRNYT
jgi:hypothetical protein